MQEQAKCAVHAQSMSILSPFLTPQRQHRQFFNGLLNIRL